MTTEIETLPERFLAAREGAVVRTGPGDDLDDVLVLPRGVRLNVIGFDGDWARITRRSPLRIKGLPDGRRALGWVPRTALSETPPAPLDWRVRVDAPAGLDVRLEPSHEAWSPGILGHGAAAKVDTIAGPWARIDGPITGWVLRCFLEGDSRADRK